MMIPKVTSAKAVRGIVKDYFKDNGKLPNKVGFIKKYVDIFTSFFITETEFRSIYSLDERDIRINEIPLVVVSLSIMFQEWLRLKEDMKTTRQFFLSS